MFRYVRPLFDHESGCVIVYHGVCSYIMMYDHASLVSYYRALLSMSIRGKSRDSVREVRTFLVFDVQKLPIFCFFCDRMRRNTLVFEHPKGMIAKNHPKTMVPATPIAILLSQIIPAHPQHPKPKIRFPKPTIQKNSDEYAIFLLFWPGVGGSTL